MADIFDIRARARDGDLRNRVIPVERGSLVPTCRNVGCGNLLTSDTGNQCLDCRTAPAIIRASQPDWDWWKK